MVGDVDDVCGCSVVWRADFVVVSVVYILDCFGIFPFLVSGLCVGRCSLVYLSVFLSISVCLSVCLCLSFLSVSLPGRLPVDPSARVCVSHDRPSFVIFHGQSTCHRFRSMVCSYFM